MSLKPRHMDIPEKQWNNNIYQRSIEIIEKIAQFQIIKMHEFSKSVDISHFRSKADRKNLQPMEAKEGIYWGKDSLLLQMWKNGVVFWIS